MTAASWRQPLLPRGRGSRAEWLGLALALGLAVLASALAIADTRSAATSARQDDPVLLAVRGGPLEPADAAAARAAERLAILPGVAGAEALDPPVSVQSVGAAGAAPSDPGVRRVRVTAKTAGSVSEASLAAVLTADGLPAAPVAAGVQNQQRQPWTAAWAVAAGGLAMLAIGLAWSLAGRALDCAASAIERLRGLGATEPRLAVLLLRGAPAGALLAGAAAAVLAVGGWLMLGRLGGAFAHAGLVPADLWPAAFALPLPGLLAAAVALVRLERSGRSWP